MDNLQIGTFGWQVPEGQGDFYPDDMPPEWQLDYYSNLFRVVLVPEEQWLQWDKEAIEACIDAVEGEFGFYLGVNHLLSKAKEAQLLVIKDAFGSLLKGVVIFSDAPIADLPQTAVQNVPVTLVSKVEALAGWQIEINGLKISGQPMGFCADLPADGKQQAAMLKNFMQSMPDNSAGAAFFIGGDSINMKLVSNLKVVGEFLGY
ncbi:MAG: hypothetical protein JXK16_10600 [Thiotrichales bacterium]|nr:hypothetical protein [Thiotrichales bacterium]